MCKVYNVYGNMHSYVYTKIGWLFVDFIAVVTSDMLQIFWKSWRIIKIKMLNSIVNE